MFLIVGSGGQLSSELENVLSKDEYVSLTSGDLDITEKDKVIEVIKQYNPKYIINCAAYTNVDKAEGEDFELAEKVNVNGVENLALAANEINAKLIHVSTDYVFDGNSSMPYKEDNQTNPKSIYGKTKRAGEIKAMEIANTCVVLRTSWLYSTYGNNFVKTISRLANDRDCLNVIFDQIGSPTYARDLAKVIVYIADKIEENTKEIYHFSNEGIASWYDFAFEIVNLQNIKCKIKPIETKDYNTLAERPLYSVLNKAKIKNKFNIEINHWKESLKECLKLF